MTEKIPFIGRKDIIDSIMNKVYNYQREDCIIDNECVYWGISGIGKTTILNEIIQRIKKDEKYNYIPVIKIDCCDYERNVILFLDNLICSIEDKLGEQIFDNYRNVKKQIHNNITDTIKDLSLEDIIPDAIESVVTILFGTGVSRAIKYGFKGAIKFKENIKYNLKEVNSVEELLVLAIIKDVEDNDVKNKVIITIDTVEKMSQEDLTLRWLLGENGLIHKMHCFFWIVMGQDQYEDVGEIDELDTCDYMDYFERILKENDHKVELLKRIGYFTKGIPYLIQYCYSEIKEPRFQELLLNNSIIDNVDQDLYARCYNRYQLQSLKLLGILATLEQWNDDCFEYIIIKLRSIDILRWILENNWKNDYSDIIKLALIRTNKNNYNFYNGVTPFYQKLLSRKDQINIISYAVDYYIRLVDKDNEHEEKQIIEDIVLIYLKWLDTYIEDVTLSYKILGAIFTMTNYFVTQENIFAWFSICFNTIKIALKIQYPVNLYNNELLELMIRCADNLCAFRKKEWLLNIQAEMYRQKDQKELMFAKALCAKAARSRARVLGFNDEIGESQYYNNIINIKSAPEILNCYKQIEDSFKRAEIMNMITSEFVYYFSLDDVKERDKNQSEFWRVLEKSMSDIYLSNDIEKERKIFMIAWFFDSINEYIMDERLRAYVNSDFILELYDYVRDNENELQNTIRGECYFQLAKFNYYNGYQKTALNYYEMALYEGLSNVHHEMWAHRSCINMYLNSTQNLEKDLDVVKNNLEFVLSHSEEISGNTFNVYMMIYIYILINESEYKSIRNDDITSYVVNCKKPLTYKLHGMDGGISLDAIRHIAYYLYKINEKRRCISWIDYYLYSIEKYASYFNMTIELYKNKINLLLLKIMAIVDIKAWDVLENAINQYLSCINTAKAVDKKIEYNNKDDIKRVKLLKVAIRNNSFQQ